MVVLFVGGRMGGSVFRAGGGWVVVVFFVGGEAE